MPKRNFSEIRIYGLISRVIHDSFLRISEPNCESYVHEIIHKNLIYSDQTNPLKT